MIEPEQTEQPSQQERKPSPTEVAVMIADQLGETEADPRSAIIKIAHTLGSQACLTLLQKTQEMEAAGGMMTSNGKRRRTPGGVWFHLARGEMTPAQRRAVWPRLKQKKPAQADPATNPQNAVPKAHKQAKPLPQPAAIFPWEDRIAAIELAETEKGQISTVKITVIGRPGKIVDKGTCIVTVMEESKTPALPKGLPTPTSTPTKYAVYIASKQWAKVKDALDDPEDVLIVEGFPKTDAQVTAIAVFATNVTTKKLQMVRRETPSK